MSAEKKPNNPSAYPGFEGTPGYGNALKIELPSGGIMFIEVQPGMTLRDYFAGQVVGHVIMPEVIGMVDPAQFATQAYEIADAMLKEREKYDSR